VLLIVIYNLKKDYEYSRHNWPSDPMRTTEKFLRNILVGPSMGRCLASELQY